MLADGSRIVNIRHDRIIAHVAQCCAAASDIGEGDPDSFMIDFGT